MTRTKIKAKARTRARIKARTRTKARTKTKARTRRRETTRILGMTHPSKSSSKKNERPRAPPVFSAYKPVVPPVICCMSFPL